MAKTTHQGPQSDNTPQHQGNQELIPNGPGTSISKLNQSNNEKLLAEVKLLRSDQRKTFERLIKNTGVFSDATFTDLSKSINDSNKTLGESLKAVFTKPFTDLKKSFIDNLFPQKDETKFKRDMFKQGKAKPTDSDLMKLPASISNPFLYLGNILKGTDSSKGAGVKGKDPKPAGSLTFLEKMFGGLGRGIKDLFTKIGEGLEKLGKDWDKKLKGVLILASLSGILIALALGLKLFADIPAIAYVKALGGIILLGIMVLLMAGLAKLIDNKLRVKMVELGIIMLMVTGSLLITAVALKIMEGVNWQTAWIGMAMYGAIVLATVLISKFTSEKDKKGMLELGALMLMLSGSLVISAIAFKIMEGVNWQTAIIGMAMYALIVGGTVVLSKVVDDKTKIGMIELGIVMNLLSISLIIAAIALQIMGGVKWDTALIGMGFFIGLVLGTAILAKIGMDAGPEALLGMGIIGLVMLAISTSLLITANALVKMNEIQWDQALKGMAFFGALILVAVLAGIAIISFPLALAGVAAFTAVAVMLGGSMAIISAGFSAFGAVDWKKVSESTGYLSSAMINLIPAFTLIAGMIVLVAPFTASAIVLSLGMIALSAAFGIFSSIDLSKTADKAKQLDLTLLFLVPTFGMVIALTPLIASFAMTAALLSAGMVALSIGFGAFSLVDLSKLLVINPAQLIMLGASLLPLAGGLVAFGAALSGSTLAGGLNAIFGDNSVVGQLQKIASIADPITRVANSINLLKDSINALINVPADKLNGVVNSVNSIKMPVGGAYTNVGTTSANETQNYLSPQFGSQQNITNTDMSALVKVNIESKDVLIEMRELLKKLTGTTSNSSREIISLNNISAIEVRR